MSTTTINTSTGTSGAAGKTAVSNTESRYKTFKNKRVKEIINDSKKPESIFPGILTKRDAGRIAKFEWDRENEKTPFQRFSGVRTKHFKESINKIFSDFCYPEIAEVPPPAVDRRALRKFAYDYTLKMCIDFFNLFTTLFTSFESFEGSDDENNFFWLKKDFVKLIEKENIESEHNSYTFPSWVLEAEAVRNERRRMENIFHYRVRRISRYVTQFRDVSSRLRREGVHNVHMNALLNNTRFNAHHTGNGEVLLTPRDSSLRSSYDWTPQPPKAKLMPEHIKKDYVRLKQIAGEEIGDCPICLCELESDFVITHCGHAFCKGCMNEHIKISRERSSGKVCPVCRESILA